VLPFDNRPWTAEARQFWKDFGDGIGTPAAAVAAPATLGVETRAVRVAPQVVLRIRPVDLNIVTQRADGDPFDVIIATNVLVYYGVFEQALALANIESMLKPGGVLLTNTALPELPASKMRSAGYSTTAYSDRAGDGDHVVWYRKQ
jgi:SAM-dependent methyltransferase